MASKAADYWTACRHPWACLLFVLPLLLIYEVGVHVTATSPEEAIRNGADAWLRTGLLRFGIATSLAPPVLLVTALIAWTWWRRDDRPMDPLGTWLGMIVESAVFALLLVAASQVAFRSANWLGAASVPGGTAHPGPVWERIISYLGAGIYEELLFRLIGYAGLLALLRHADTPQGWDLGVASFASALIFAGAHHLGPHGEAFDGFIFAFRTAAGVYFAWLYQLRGFGIAVGTHAGYDVLVGLLLFPHI